MGRQPRSLLDVHRAAFPRVVASRTPVFPWGSTWAFGVDIGGARVRVYSGPVQIGTQASQWTSQTDVTIDTDDTYVYIERDTDAGTVTIQASKGAEPSYSDANLCRRLLYLIGWTGSAAYLKRVLITGWSIPARFGDA